MTENRWTLRWKRGSALLGLLSLLALWVTTASHVHLTSTQGSARQECQLCVVAATPVLITASLALSTFAEIVEVFVFAELQSRYRFWQPISSPRSPPFVS